MADKQQAPQAHEDQAQPGSLWEAQSAILGLLEPEEEKPKEEEAKPEESEESTEETQDELPEEETEEVESEEEESEEEDVSEESDEEEEPEEEDDTPELYTVKVNGEDHQVTAEELIKGYSRQADYTKKTQELSQYRQQLDEAAQFYQQEVAATQEARQQYINSVASAVQLNLSSLKEYENIDWERLKTEDKEEYLTKRDEYREAQANVEKLKQTYDQESQHQAAEQQQQFQQWAQGEHAKLVSIIPDWGVPQKQQAIAKELREFAFTKGFQEEELKQLFDHRSILILMQAKAWEDDQKRAKGIKAKKIKNKPKVARSGKGTTKSDSSKAKSAAKMKRLRQTGHVDDAASLLEDLFNS
jgi:cytochrome oxidase Cu insertion factor (SCO1/SenC/PrrC family)